MKVIEKWKPVKDFDGYYISNLGRVKSTRSFKGTQELILNGSFNQQGYKTITMMRKKKVYTKTLHRLLANAFIPNPNKLPCINHKNGIKTDNKIDNLEWCTYSHNNKEAYKMGLKEPAWTNNFGINHPNSKKVNQYDKNGNYIKTWDCISDVQRVMNILVTSIVNCCNGYSNSAGGYKWRYTSE